MISVMGATGHTGRVAAERLLAAGLRVRVIGRSAERLQSLVDRGAEPMAGDPSEVAFLTSAFQGAEAVYAMVPTELSQPDPRRYYNRAGETIAQALRNSGVKRIVLLSSVGAELPEGTGPIKGLHDVEEKLTAVGTDFLSLRPGYFYENFYGSLGLIKHQGINGGTIEPDLPMMMTATEDIGAAAAEELTAGEWQGTSVRELVGPRDYTMAEATRILGEKIGKPDLQYVRFPDADAMQAMVQMGMSLGYAEAVVEMSHALNEGRVRSHQGRSGRTATPTKFEEFADELAAAYRAL